MLTQEKFMYGLTYISAWYPNRFDFQVFKKDAQGKRIDEFTFAYELWYGAFEKFSDENFEHMVVEYCNYNEYPPSSPTNLLNFARKSQIEQNKGNVDKAWGTLIDMIQQYGWNVYRSVEGSQYTSNLNNAIDNQSDVVLRKVFYEMRNKLREMNEYNRNKTRESFEETYQKYMIKEINDNFDRGNLKLTNDKETKMIGSD